MTVYEMTPQQMVRNSNVTLNTVVDGLRREGYITQEQADHIHTNYSIVIEQRDWLPDFLIDWLGIKENTFKPRLVKAIGREKGSA